MSLHFAFRSIRWGAPLLVALATAAACGGTTTTLPPGTDSGLPTKDGGTVDGSNDSGAADSGPGDTGSVDSTVSDTGVVGDSSPPVDSGGADARDSSTPDASGKVPVYHRPDDSQCSQPAPAGNCPIMGGNAMCTMDTQCTMGTNGRCIESGGGALFCLCTYDTCTHDTDCPMNELCACHGSPFFSAGNTCTAGNCRVDSDCGAQGYCSPSHGGMNCGGLTGYYCHTASDTCVNDSDCAPGMGMGPQVCGWSSTDNRWECLAQELCP